MKVSLICTETRIEHVPETVMRFVNSFGQDDGNPVTIPAHTVRYNKGQTFTAKNKADVKAALATGIWRINQ